MKDYNSKNSHAASMNKHTTNHFRSEGTLFFGIIFQAISWAVMTL